MLQGFSEVARMPPLEVLDRGILRDSSPIHLEWRRPEALQEVHIGLVFLLPTVNRRGPLIPRIFSHLLLLGPFLRADLLFF